MSEQHPDQPSEPEASQTTPPKSRPGQNHDTMLAPTEKLTTRQILYLFILHGLAAMLISGGINFAIAYAMYTPTTPITLWSFPHPLSGDAAVTILLTNLLTYAIQYFLVTLDISKARIAPTLAHAPTDSLSRWFFKVPYPSSTPSSPTSQTTNSSTTPSSSDTCTKNNSILSNLSTHLLRIAILTSLCFVTIWGPCVGILACAGTQVSNHEFVFPSRWTPQIFKLVMGVVLGGFLAPFLAWFWMVRAGMESTEGAEGGGDAQMVERGEV